MVAPREREQGCELLRPRTIREWFRRIYAQKYDSSGARRGPWCPRQPEETRNPVLAFANDNLNWGYTKIRDAVNVGLGIDIVIKLDTREVHIAGIRVARGGVWMKHVARRRNGCHGVQLSDLGGFLIQEDNMTRRFLHLALALASASTACARETDHWIDPGDIRLFPTSAVRDALIKGRIAHNPAWYTHPKESLLICPSIELSVLITRDELWVGLTTGLRWHVRKADGRHDFEGLAAVLQENREMPALSLRHDIEVAATATVTYADILEVVDRAVAAEFTDVAVLSPSQLSVSF